MTKSPYSFSRDSAGHYLVSRAPTGKPVAVIYAHNVPDILARNRAQRFVDMLNGKNS